MSLSVILFTEEFGKVQLFVSRIVRSLMCYVNEEPELAFGEVISTRQMDGMMRRVTREEVISLDLSLSE